MGMAMDRNQGTLFDVSLGETNGEKKTQSFSNLFDV
jgi:hypothetical protein